MSDVDIVRGWKDQSFRDSALIGGHPAGAIDTADFHGGRVLAASTREFSTFGCCTVWPNCSQD